MMKKKSYLWMLAGVMTILLSFVPGIAPMQEVMNEVHASGSDEKTITGLGTGAITDPDSSIPGSWCYVYYGHAKNGENRPEARYRVLQKDTIEFSKEDKDGKKIMPLTHTMFLDSDKLFLGMDFQNVVWKESAPYKWLNENEDGFYKDSAYLTDAERTAITESYRKLASSYTSLTGERVFIPDVFEVNCSAYGYYSDLFSHDCRKKSYFTGGDADKWWLRTDAGEWERKVTSDGDSSAASPVTGWGGVSPAFNLELSSILFSSLVSGEVGSAGAEYKLTIKDENLEISAGKAQIHENTVTVPYLVSGNNVKRISVLLIDREYKPGETVLCSDNESDFPHVTYLKLNTNDNIENGTGSFELPAEYTHLTCGVDYHAYLVAEKLCGNKETDYASEPVEINIPKATADICEHEFEYALNGDRIIASCKKAGCWYHEHGISVGMKLPEELDYEAGTAREASVTGYPGVAIMNLAEMPGIRYYRSIDFGSIEQKETTTVTPDTPGDYVAVMSWGGLTVKKAFSIIDVDTQGTEGANIRWYLSKDGILTITGNGAVRDYNNKDEIPWYKERNKIVGIRIAKGVSGVGKIAFDNLTKVTSIILPEGLKSIGEYAFRKNIPETITIPKSVSYIGGGAFLSNTIKKIIVEEGNENYKIEGGVLFTKDGKELLNYPTASVATSYNVPDTVERIACGAFAGSSRLAEIGLPRGLKRIEDYAFSNTAIDKLDIPDGVEYIGSCIGDSELREVIVPRTASLDYYPFYYARKLEDIKYVGTQSEWNSFECNIFLSNPSVKCDYREDISNYIIDEIDKQKYIGEPLTPKVTVRNPQTGKVLIENTDYTVEYSNNTDCGNAEVVVTGNCNLPGSKSRYEGSVSGYFQIGSKIAKVTFRVVNGYWSDGTNADKTVSVLAEEDKDLKLKESDIPEVGNKPAKGYKVGSWNETPDKDTVLTGNKTYIYTYTEKTAAVVDDSNKDKTDKDQDPNKEQQTDPKQKVVKEEGVGTFSADGTVLTDPDGDKFYVSGKIKADKLKKNMAIADKKSGGKYKITKLIKKKGKIVDGTVTYMKPYNKNCKKISATGKVKLSGMTFTVTAIAPKCAKGCKQLKKVVIGSYVTTIGANAFSGCSSLTTVTIKNGSLTTIGVKAFYNCKKLNSFSVTGLKLKKVGSNAFKNTNSKITFKCPKSKLKNYEKLFKKAGASKKAKYTK